ncbi:MarR family winged helix-turn-helix transcriptional regulator [Protofrankia symbiont of Coriaria ruscifolia]|uniref:MarR family transcriptional regulator n=1 Tax=Candidatus Protofrankia californiensis TaxID=1839754 RepID=A0A1C3P1U8_9ACTN|nr:MarR family winged helix-turn-helix transcriptional regulator [Protofrankia symbiont of Coriaria ruscifolia]SBW23799.1 MarR family transcriptional regulator [Candidatus Protofrankia californiensis]
MPAKTGDRVRPSYFSQLAVERLDIALCRASAAVARAADAHAVERGTGVGQHLVLKMLNAVGPCSQQTLSDELRIDRSVMVNICDDLERAGHVRRERNPRDRRSYAVTITDTGQRRLADVEKSIPDFLDEAFQPLSHQERDHLTALLSKLLNIDV